MEIKKVVTVMTLALSTACAVGASWTPTSGSMLTRWGKQVTPDNAWREYPRPQLERKDWQSLNGLWQLAMDADAKAADPKFDHTILVPYPVESALSGVGKHSDTLLYKRTFTVPTEWKGQRVLLHFDAVDWKTSVKVNGKTLKTTDGDESHEGGYDRFSYDITDALKDSGEQEVMVSVFDPTDKGAQPRGKQVLEPKGIFYTPSSGIWQSVWLEPVSAKGYIRSVKFTPNAEDGMVDVAVDAQLTGSAAEVEVAINDGPTLTLSPKEKAQFNIEKPQLWSPNAPHLYDVTVKIKDSGTTLDSVKAYFAFRTIETKMDGDFRRIYLNGKEIFQLGPLDQGFWPDGLHTPPSEDAMRWDIDYTRDMGFNMIRKHIKVEPDSWYYHCDKTGMLVWQDCVSGGVTTPEGRRLFEQDMHRMIESHGNSPAIVLWVIFNEGWGQYDTARLTEEVKKLDPSRIITNPSGWVDNGVGDTKDMHKYPGPGAPDPEKDRASVLGEFGGLGFPVKDHMWNESHWGYQSVDSPEKLFARFSDVMNGLKYLRATRGLNGAVYTQTTDVETEANGLVTYDREYQKMDTAKVRAINEAIIKMGELKVLAETALPTSGTAEKAPMWKYTTEKPGDGWMQADFDDSTWKEGAAGFGNVTKRIFGPVGTEWKSEDIWVRRSFDLPTEINREQVELISVHVDDAEVYINGVKASEFENYVTGYTPTKLSPEAAAALKPGASNTIAIHCHNKEETKDIGQYIDAGLIQQAP